MRAHSFFYTNRKQNNCISNSFSFSMIVYLLFTSCLRAMYSEIVLLWNTASAKTIIGVDVDATRHQEHAKRKIIKDLPT